MDRRPEMKNRTSLQCVMPVTNGGRDWIMESKEERLAGVSVLYLRIRACKEEKCGVRGVARME